MRRVAVNQAAYQIHQRLSLLGPGVGQVNLLSPPRDLRGFVGMGSHVLYFPGKIFCVARIKVDEGLFVEIVLNT